MYNYLTLLCIILLSTNFHAQNPTEKLDSFLTLLEKHDKFMGSVAIRKGTELEYSRAVGWASVQDTIENSPATKFRIGSVSKIFTASLIFQMIEENAISLETSLARFYPDIPNADSITIDHLLSHRSGIYNITNDPGYKNYMERGTTKEEMLERIIEKGSDFQPGTQAQYSNSNYILLGYILEKLTDQHYAKILRDRICQPLGLKNTYYEDSTELEVNENYSYRYIEKKWARMPETHMSIPHGAGAIVATPTDLTDFIHALFELRVVSQKSLEAMKEIRGGIGRGLFRFSTNGQDTAFGHGGAIDGFYTQIFYYPNLDISIALCTNGLNYRDEHILNGLLDIYLDRPFALPDFIPPNDLPDSNQMLAYVGYYICEHHPLDIELFIENDQIYAQASGQSPFPLYWETKNVLSFPAANIVIDFSNTEKVNGTFQSFVITQGKSFQFQRKE